MPTLTPEKLAEFQAAFDEAQSKAGEDMVRAVRKLFSNYIARVESIVLQVAARPGTSISLPETQAVLADMIQALELAGRDDLIREFQTKLAEVAGESLRYYDYIRPGSGTLGGISADTLNALGRDFVSELELGIDQKLVRPAASLIRDSMLTATTREDAVREITNAIESGGVLRRDGQEFTQANIEVFVQDSERRFARHTRTLKADELGLNIVVFTNPLDSKTAEQCRFLATTAKYGVPGFWYKDEFTTDLHPQLKDPPLVVGGHWNCRGTVDFVDLEYAISQGFRPRRGDSSAEG